MTKILDVGGTPRDANWLKARYGAEIGVAPAGAAFRLTTVKCTVGPAAVMVRVRANGVPASAHGVAFSWADGPTALAGTDFVSKWQPRCAVQWTDANGVTGFGVGAGAYIRNIADGGPHAAWVLHHQFASDALLRVGMLGGTEHEGPFDLSFELQLAAAPDGPDTPPAPPDLPAGIEPLLRAMAEDLRALRVHLGA